MGQSYRFQWSVITDNWHLLLAGAWIDVWISLVGFALACVIGLLVAFGRLSSVRAISGPAYAFVQVACGIPPYVLLLWIHFGLANLLGLALTPVQSIVAVLALTGGGYAAEIFRAGILAVDRGQFEAARSLGLGRRSVWSDVILPQAVRVVVAPLGNVMISLLKSATLMGVIAVPDLLHRAQGINVMNFTPFEAFTAVLVIFVSMVFVISMLVLAIERALVHP